jgi:ABC-type antimicrobial peptide transport system permease subunit
MNNRDIIGLSVQNLLRRKTRTILAIVGVVIGICAIICTLSLGYGLQDSYTKMVEEYGNLHMITVYPAGGGGGGLADAQGAGGGRKKKAKLDNAALKTIGAMTGVAAISPVESAYLTFGSGRYIAEVQVSGVQVEVMEKFDYKVKEGRLLEVGDTFAALFGSEVPPMFYNPKQITAATPGRLPVNVMRDKLILTADRSYGYPRTSAPDPTRPKVDYKQYKIKGVGVLVDSDDFQVSYNVYMPLETVKKINEETARAERKRYNRNAPYQQAMIYVGDLAYVQTINAAVREMGFQTSSLNDALEMVKGQSRMIQMVLGGIGAISLLVAAIGITNTMVMSIYERTKEIGVMKVIGADLPDIRKLFLIEAALIGFGGGCVGVALSYGLSWLMNTLLSNAVGAMIGAGGGAAISRIPLWLPLAALAFSTAVGVIAGYSPARRAMNLSALESLRNE